MTQCSIDSQFFEQFADSLYFLLAEHNQGLSEFDLLKLLQSRGFGQFEQQDFSDNYALFFSHFILFHTLYRLRDRLHKSQQAELEIGCLKIALHPYQSSQTELPAKVDGLRDYYMDLKNLTDTTQSDVKEMLGQFWQRYTAYEHGTQALQVLGFDHPVAFADIKKRYHQLALQHHPDKGGEKQRLQQINAAMDILKRGR